MSDKKLFLSVITVLLVTFTCIFGISADDETFIRWEPVPGAGGYILEIRNSEKKILINEELKDTVFNISKLSTGEYQYRLTTLNKLKRKGNSTGWINLTIEKAVIPVLIKVSQKILSHSYENPPFTVYGENFLKDTKLYLKSDSQKIELNTLYISGGELKVNFSAEKPVTGTYDIVAVNRGGFESAMPAAIQIIDPDIPVLIAVSQEKIYNSLQTRLVVKGANLAGDTEIIVYDEKGNRVKINQQIISADEISIDVPPSPGYNGLYNLTAVKRQYFPSAKKIQISVIDPSLPFIETISQNIIYNSEKTKIVIKGKNLSGDAVVNVEGADGKKLQATLESSTDNEIVVSLNPGRDEKGVYQISAVKEKLFRSGNSLKIEIVDKSDMTVRSLSEDNISGYETETKSPKIVSVEPGDISISRGRFVLKLNGENISEKTDYELRSGDTVLRPYKVYSDNKTVYLYFEEEKYKGGEYSLHYENKSNQPVILEKKIPLKDASSGLFGLNVLALAAGLDFNILKNEWKSQLESPEIGFHIYASYPLSSLSYTKDIFFLQNCGIEALYSYEDYRFLSESDYGDEYFRIKSGYLGLNYPIRLSFINYRLSLIVNLDAGGAYSGMNILTNNRFVKYSSFDFTIKGGVSLRYEWFNYFFTDLSTEFSKIFYISHPIEETKISVRAGVML